jgi:hypothetical protein
VEEHRIVIQAVPEGLLVRPLSTVNVDLARVEQVEEDGDEDLQEAEPSEGDFDFETVEPEWARDS